MRHRLVKTALALAASSATVSAQPMGTENDHSVPYRMSVRASPVTASAMDLLPDAVGGFSRKDVQLISDEEIQAEFQNAAAERLIVFASINSDPAMAEEGVDQCLANGTEIRVQPDAHIRKPQLHYYQAGQVICWSRGSYFFSVEPADDEIRPESFDTFMTSFPY